MTDDLPNQTGSRANPARTAEHFAEMEARRQQVRDFFRDHLPEKTAFVWEIGCGHGHYLTAYANKFSEKICIGIDTSSDRIDRARRKSNRARLTNVHFLHTEAELFLSQIPSGSTITDIFILFPDPWPKKRHHKNRIARHDFLTELAKRAGQGAHLYFRTDFIPYLDEVRKTVLNHHDWEVVEAPWPFEHETVFQSRANGYGSLIARQR